MDIRWTKNLRGEEKEKRIKEIQGYRLAFEALAEVLEKERQTIKVDYDQSNWPHKAADIIGSNRRLDDILKLLKI